MSIKPSFFEKITGTKSVQREPRITQSQLRRPQRPPAQEPPQEKITRDVQIQEETPKKETPNLEKRKKEFLSEAEGQLVLDVYQDDGNIIVKSTLAGVKPEDIDITITNDMLSIKGAREKEENIEEDNYYYQECYWGAFSRSVILPTEVEADRIQASIKNGVLTIVLPKAEKVKTKKISVIEQ